MAGMARIVSRICELNYKRPALAMRESGDDRTNHNRLGAFLAQCVRKPWLASIPAFSFRTLKLGRKGIYEVVTPP